MNYLDMQDSYMLMGQNMAAQYELQKLEPALRCELYQVECSNLIFTFYYSCNPITNWIS